MASARSFAQHVRVSSTDELAYPATKGEISETIQTIVTGRKCWKTMKGKGEVVWPPYLEAALVEGLEKYTPVESRTTRAFGRFPMRNKFISDYIYSRTGKRRTPKQVGSRLQQLRDTAEGKRILQVLSSRHIAMMQPSRPSPPPSSSASPSPASSTPCSVVPISGPLRALDPTVTFVSRSVLHARSRYRVLRAAPGPDAQDAGELVHTERTALELRASSVLPTPVWPAPMACTFLYATPFVPRFWDALCTCTEPAQYTVVQDIVRAPADAGAGASPSAPSPVAEDDGEVLLTVVYRFDGQGQGQGVATGTATPGASPPLSPASFDSESSHELGSDYGDLLMYSGLAAQQQPGSAALAPSLSTQSLPSLASMPALAPQAHPSPPPPHSPAHLAHLHTHSPAHLGHAHSPAHAQAHLHAHHGAGTDAYASLPPSPLEQLSFGAHAHAHAPQQQQQQQQQAQAQQQGVPSVFDAPQYSGFDGAGAYGMKFPSL